jgi:hypothetical protein
LIDIEGRPAPTPGKQKQEQDATGAALSFAILATPLGADQ